MLKGLATATLCVDRRRFETPDMKFSGFNDIPESQFWDPKSFRRDLGVLPGNESAPRESREAKVSIIVGSSSIFREAALSYLYTW